MRNRNYLLIAFFGLMISTNSFGQINLNKVKKKVSNPLEKNESQRSTNSNDSDQSTFVIDSYNELLIIVRSLNYSTIQGLEDAMLDFEAYDYVSTKTKLSSLDPNTLSETAKKLHGYYLSFERYGNLEGKEIPGENLKLSLIETANSNYKRAWEMKSTYPSNAIDLLRHAIKVIELSEILFPEEEKNESTRVKTEKLLDELGGAYEADFTSEFHKKHVGKIIFSNERIEIEKEPIAKSSFGEKEHIYAIAYLEGPIKSYIYNFSEGTNNAQYSVQIDGKQQTIFFEILKEFKDQNFWQIEIVPDPSNSIHETNAIDWYSLLKNLAPDEHELKLWLWMNGKQVAEFELPLTLNWQNGADSDWLKSNADKAIGNAEYNFSKIRKLPNWFDDANVPFTATDLSERKIAEMYKAKVSDCAEVIKVHVYFRDAENSQVNWVVEKNDFDIPTRKIQNGIIGIVYKSTDGSCYYEEYIDLTMNYEGGGKYGSPILKTAKADRKMIHCSNI